MSKGQNIKKLYGVILANLQDTSQTAIYVASRPYKVEKIPDYNLTINVHKRNRLKKTIINLNKVTESININSDFNKKKFLAHNSKRSKRKFKHRSKNNYRHRSKCSSNYKSNCSSNKRSKKRSKQIYTCNSKRNSNNNIKNNVKKKYNTKTNQDIYEGYYL
ncbi:hypothetical protein QKC54_gp0272 [Megavirus baoshan]|uniref:Uncharacterized protein n=1 Tax=Megavirus baoshan TaxID=2496520 RepID=A0A3Q8U851_9VIRU|nr:hypothetical protein QKC54_gp0272 [Megavirus baoshan]AZL89544.1 hypothetical protein Mb0800 [Megavirus baoshan]